jgi:hemerythrin
MNFRFKVETNLVAIEWLTKHICTMDRALAERVQQQSRRGLYELPF